MALIENVDLLAATPGKDINWLEDVTLLEEEGTPAVFDRYSNSFIRIYFEIPAGREDEIVAGTVLIKSFSGRQLLRDQGSRSSTASSRSPIARPRGSR